VLRARCHFCFYSNLPLELVSLVFFCVEKEIQKKKSLKGQKKPQPKAQERALLHASFLDSILYARTRLCICAFKTSGDRKTLSRFTPFVFLS